jgi:hypothetical protein
LNYRQINFVDILLNHFMYTIDLVEIIVMIEQGLIQLLNNIKRLVHKNTFMDFNHVIYSDYITFIQIAKTMFDSSLLCC